MKEQFRKTMARLNRDNRPVTVAVSGGADSMALLWLMCRVAPACGFSVTAAHYDHGLRGEESRRDAAFVADVCRAWQVPLVSETGDVAAYAAQHGLGIEAAARECRYAFLKRVNQGYVVTAHHADDQLETVLLHLCRGSGLDGLCGMKEQNGFLLRPLLQATHAQLLDLCRTENIPFVKDSTNEDDGYARNFLRHQVVPLLQQQNPDLTGAVWRMCRSLSLDRACLDELAESYLKQNRTENGLRVMGFNGLHPAVQNRVALRWLQQSGFAYRSEAVADLCRLMVSGRGCCEPVRGRRLRVERGLLVEEPTVSLTDFHITWEQQDASVLYKNGKIHKLFLKNAVDCDKIVGDPVLRTRKAGDTLALAHRGVKKSLSRLFTEEQVPHGLRRVWPVLCDDCGVIWVYGFGVDRRVCADETTRRVLTVSGHLDETGKRGF